MEDFATEIMFARENVDFAFYCWLIRNRSKFEIEIWFISGTIAIKLSVQSTI